MKTKILCVLRWACVSTALSLGAAAQEAKTPPLDPPLLEKQSERLFQAISEAVQASGGDLDKQHIHLVFAFSTGHFAKDPLMAEAAREVASDIAANHLVNGDQLSGYAWEMKVWPHKGSTLNPLTVGPDRAAMHASFQDLWPRSPQSGSNGGHDTEATISQLANRLKKDSSAVLVMLTNSAASQAGTNSQKTVGENSPAYLATLRNWTRVKTSSTTGATVQLAVEPNRPDRVFDAVIVLPKRYSAAALTASRATLLSTETQTTAASTSKRTGLPWWVWLLAGLGFLGIALVALRAWNSRNVSDEASPARSSRRASARSMQLALQVGGRQFPLDAVKNGETVCILCGPSYPVGTTPGQYVLLPQDDLPDQRLLVVTRERQGLKLTPEPDINVSGELPAFLPMKEEEYRIRVSGRAARQNLPPRPFQTEIPLTLITQMEN